MGGGGIAPELDLALLTACVGHHSGDQNNDDCDDDDCCGHTGPPWSSSTSPHYPRRTDRNPSGALAVPQRWRRRGAPGNSSVGGLIGFSAPAVASTTSDS